MSRILHRKIFIPALVSFAFHSTSFAKTTRLTLSQVLAEQPKPIADGILSISHKKPAERLEKSRRTDLLAAVVDKAAAPLDRWAKEPKPIESVRLAQHVEARRADSLAAVLDREPATMAGWIKQNSASAPEDLDETMPEQPADAVYQPDTRIAGLSDEANAAAANFDPSEIVIEVVAQDLEIDNREILNRLEVGKRIKVKIVKSRNEPSPNIFVRDESLLSFDAEKSELVALAQGKTELFVQAGTRLNILAVGIGTKDEGPSSVPELLALAALPLNPPDSDKSDKDQILAQTAKPEEKRFTNTENLTFDVDPRIEEERLVRLQIIDEVSGAEKSFPIEGVNIVVPGTKIAEVSDSLGQVKAFAMPKGGRFYVKVVDPYERYLPSLVTVYTESPKTQTIRLMSRKRREDIGNALALNEADAGICGRIESSKGVEDVSLEILADGQSPIQGRYFTASGFPDLAAKTVGSFGRYCLFYPRGSLPLVRLRILRQGEILDERPLSLYENYQPEYDVNLDDRLSFSTYLSQSLGLDGRYRGVELSGNLFSMLAEPFTLEAYSRQAAPRELAFSEGRAFYMLGQIDGLEPTVYSVDKLTVDDDPVTMTVPSTRIRSLFEAAYAQNYVTNQEPDSGTVLVEYGYFAGEEKGPIDIRLLDEEGRQVGQGYGQTLGKHAVEKVFFNVSPGSYEVQVIDAEGRLVANETTVVYSDTLSFLRKGSPVVALTSEGHLALNE